MKRQAEKRHSVGITQALLEELIIPKYRRKYPPKHIKKLGMYYLI